MISQFASTCADKLDPHEEADFVLPFSPILAASETIESDFTLVVRPEAALLGLRILSTLDGHPAPFLMESDKSIQLWLGIDEDERSNAAFDGAGTFLGFEVFFETSEERRRNRTFKVQVAQL